ncbi:MAG: hypothetical protein K0A89_10060 [ANME-2 cluster archaeon]|nr:hypothetical protein [ANME-2 cluster archaeon]
MMKTANKSKCPKCGFGFFESEPNRYDIFEYVHGDFEVLNSEYVECEMRIYCRSCKSEIDKNASQKEGHIIVK